MLLSYKFHTMLLLLYVITSPNLKLIAHFHTELWSFKVVNLDVCGSLVLSNPVTYHESSLMTVMLYIYCMWPFVSLSSLCNTTYTFYNISVVHPFVSLSPTYLLCCYYLNFVMSHISYFITYMVCIQNRKVFLFVASGDFCTV